MADGRVSGSAGKTLLVWLAILGLLAAVGWLASERNARTWYLVPEDGRLVVKRGLMLPAGRGDFETANPDLAKAYAPLVPPSAGRLPAAERTFSDQADLDQGLYDTLAGWAREDVATGEQARLDRGLGYIGRALLLPGLSTAQRDRSRRPAGRVGLLRGPPAARVGQAAAGAGLGEAAGDRQHARLPARPGRPAPAQGAGAGPGLRQRRCPGGRPVGQGGRCPGEPGGGGAGAGAGDEVGRNPPIPPADPCACLPDPMRSGPAGVTSPGHGLLSR
ncbi:MAG: hypothetical protein QM767_28670 [Anaeromyxobacter sp.]